VAVIDRAFGGKTSVATGMNLGKMFQIKLVKINLRKSVRELVESINPNAAL